MRKEMTRGMKQGIACCLLLALLLGLTACGQKEETKTPLADISARLLEKQDQLTAMLPDDLYQLTGIEEKDVSEIVYLTSKDGLGTQEVILLRPADGADRRELEKKLNGYLDQRREETRDYLPEVFALLEKCRVENTGSTLTLMICPDAAQMMKDFSL